MERQNQRQGCTFSALHFFVHGYKILSFLSVNFSTSAILTDKLFESYYFGELALVCLVSFISHYCIVQYLDAVMCVTGRVNTVTAILRCFLASTLIWSKINPLAATNLAEFPLR